MVSAHHHHNVQQPHAKKSKQAYRLALLASLLLFLALATNIRWSFKLGTFPSTSSIPIDAFGFGAPSLLAQTWQQREALEQRLKNKKRMMVKPTDTIYLQRSTNATSRSAAAAAMVWDFSPIVLEDYKLVFFPLPPATLWKKLFRRMMGYADWNTREAADLHDSAQNGLMYLRDFNQSYATTIMTSPKYTRAIFVRDPLEKFYSVYQETVLSSNGEYVRRRCCPIKQDCFPSHNVTPEAFLYMLDKTQCRDVRWASITERMDAKYWKYVNFAGHWDKADKDAQKLLERIGVWNLFGASGWGKNGTQSFSSQLMLIYQPFRRRKRMEPFYEDPAREALVNQVYRQDYENQALGFSRMQLVQPEDYIYFKNVREWDASPIVVEQFNLVFFTIPKNACTTWKMLFRRINGVQDYQNQDERRGLPHDPTRNGLRYLWSYSLEEANQIMTSPDYTRAIFVRDPKERFLSAYLDKAVSTPDFIFRKCCRNSTQVNLRDLACSSEVLTPLQFLDLIEGCIDVHWLAQHYRMEEKYWPYINFVGRFETVQEDAKELLQRVGAWDEFGASGWGKYGWDPIFHAGSHRHQTHITDSRNKYSWYMTREIEQRVEDFYAVDYENPKLGFVRNRTSYRSNSKGSATIMENLKGLIEPIG